MFVHLGVIEKLFRI